MRQERGQAAALRSVPGLLQPRVPGPGRKTGHSGDNCRPAGGKPAHKAADAEVAPRVPDTAAPTAPGVDSASLAPAANTCHACGKSDGRLLCCGRCRGVWFCNRECQEVARKELGHRGANCRPADGAQKPESSANARAPFAAPSRPSTPIDMLIQRFNDLSTEAKQALRENTRIGHLASAEKYTEAVSVADLIGGAGGAVRRSDADQRLAHCLFRMGNTAAAARAACSSLRAARASGSRTFLATSLATCGTLASQAPDEMAKAERESREQERISGSPSSYGDNDLWGASAFPPPRPTSPGWASHTTKPRSPHAMPPSQPSAAATAPPPTTNEASRRCAMRQRRAASLGSVCTNRASNSAALSSFGRLWR